MAKRVASIDKKRCVACGVCENICPLAAVKIYRGCYAAVEAFVNETLDYNPDVKCSHHEHNHREKHACDEHGCGSYSCH